KLAVKRMLGALTRSDEMLRRFENEARAAARIGHPGIVDVLDLGSDEAGTYLVMELLDGEELEQRVQRDGPLPIDEVVALGTEIADAVAAAHDAGIIHRDLKPANVFLCKRRGAHPRVKLLDFGIAKLLFDDDGAQTRTGAVLGTPLYMAPEQLRDSKQVDARADVYSAGAILYFALTGAPPLDAATLPALAFKVSAEEPALASTKRAETPQWLDALLARTLRKDPDARLQSMHALLAALEAGGSNPGGTVALPSTPPTSPPPADPAAAPERQSESRDTTVATARSAVSEKATPARRGFWLLLVAMLLSAGTIWWKLDTPSPSASADPAAAEVASSPATPVLSESPQVVAQPATAPRLSASVAPDARAVQTPVPVGVSPKLKPSTTSVDSKPPPIVPR
ncbi:MAG TPA: serine/threonine-protein kinase, partial [Polyangiaceae bacterium]|nr:serine/threonine-protein kinase [Polyangiaceae bacterium]